MSDHTRNPAAEQQTVSLCEACKAAPVAPQYLEHCQECGEDMARETAKSMELLAVVRAWGKAQGMTHEELDARIQHMYCLYPVTEQPV
jgi:hypothetical protein